MWGKSKIGITLWNFKHIGRLIVRLKTIEYKKDFFCYLSSYPDLGFQTACLQILFFRSHTFKSFLLGRMPSRFSIKHICSSFGSQICFNNLNLVPYAVSLVDEIPKAHIAAMSQFLSCYCIELQSSRSNTRELYLLYSMSCTLITCIMVLKA